MIKSAKKKHNIYIRNTKQFDRENFLLDLLEIDWDSTLSCTKNDPNLSFKKFHSTITNLLDKYLPLKKITKQEFKQRFKPWNTKIY